MVSETNKPDHVPVDREKHKHLDREIKEMIFALTNRLASLQNVHRAGSSHHEDQVEDNDGVRIITLAGNNVGATMRGEMDEKLPGLDGDLSAGENEALSTYVNSNFQSINNSIMLGGSYSTNDPGVHMDISDNVEEPSKQEKKGKKKRPSSKSDQQNEYSE